MNKQTFLFSLFLVLASLEAYPQKAIYTAEDLRSIAMDGHYYLMEDLEVDDWQAAGVFTGSFDGRGHSITLNGCRPDLNGNMGLFAASNGAEISNLIVSGWIKEFSGYGGSLVGHAIQTTINNCETDAHLITDSITAITGGLVGCLDGGSLYNCSSHALLEGFKLGGLAGTVKAGAVIRNSYSNASFLFSSKFTTPEVGLLVHDNEGLLENNYAHIQTKRWFIPSFGQLCMLMGVQALCRAMNHAVAWNSGFTVSSSMYYEDFYFGCLETGEARRMSQNHFPSVLTNVKYAHDFYGIGYNVGDLIYIGGVLSFVFYVHEDGKGGWATPIVDNTFKRHVTSAISQQLDGYYNRELFTNAQNYDYAQWHDGHVAHGGTSTVIPPGYDKNPGKFFTQLMQERDNNTNTLINTIRIDLARYNSTPYMKQLAYTNSGEIHYCYYPFVTTKYGLVNGAPADHCCRYEEGATPYVYGQFGPCLYQGNNTTEMALADTLNAWVKASGVDDYSTWTVVGERQVNDNMPIHRYDFDNGDAMVNLTFKKGRTCNHMSLRYADINDLSEEQIAFGNTLAYYGNQNLVNADNITNPWGGSLFVTEEAAVKGNYRLNANVGIILDNSDASGFAGANYDWHMFSTPLSNAPVGITYFNYTCGGPYHEPSQVFFNQESGYFPTNTPYNGWDFYCYDEPNDGWPNFKRRTDDHYHHGTGAPINYTNETTLVPGKGYLWAVGKKTGLQAIGTLNNGPVTRAVTHKGGCYPGYNLVGNPYHANLDFNAFASDNSSMLSQTAYTILDMDKQGYVTYCPDASENPLYASRYLHSHQGFFVQVNKNGNLLFNPDQTVTMEEVPFRDHRPAYPLVNLIVTDHVGRNDYATVELERPETGGAFKMKGLKGCDGEISISHDLKEYSIAFIERQPRTLPVRFKASAEGDYTLRWDLRNGEFGYLHLIDHITGTEVDCLETKEYVFHASPSDYASRFQLVFAPTSVDESVDVAASSSDFAYWSDNAIVVEGQGQLSLFDLHGRLLQTTSVDEYHNRWTVSGLAAGVYVLRLMDAGHVRMQKILLY